MSYESLFRLYRKSPAVWEEVYRALWQSVYKASRDSYQRVQSLERLRRLFLLL